MKKKPQEQPRWPQHKMGKSCGYEEYEDGSIRIADTHADFMSKAMTEQEGVNLLLKAVTDHCAVLLQRTHTLREHFWKSVADDYGLDYVNYEYFYEPSTKRITRRLTKQSEPENK